MWLSCHDYLYKLKKVVEWKIQFLNEIDPFIYNVEKWSNIILKSCSVNNARFLMNACPFFSIMKGKLFWMNIRYEYRICNSNGMFKREIWNKFPEFTFLKFWNLLSETREISKFKKISDVNFPQISRINMWFLVNYMWQALKEHTRVRITEKTINQYQQIY